jgi:hypothetical protein
VLRRILFLACCATCGLSLSACYFAPPNGSTQVARGEQFQTGDPQFDRFFSALREHRLALDSAPDAEREVLRPLAELLKLQGAPSSTALGDAIATVARELTTPGRQLRLITDGWTADASQDTSAQVRVTGKQLSTEELAFVEAVVRTVREQLSMMASTRRRIAELERLRLQLPLLTSLAPDHFGDSGSPRRSEVLANLRAAEQLLPVLIAYASDITEQSEATARTLTQSLVPEDSNTHNASAPLVVQESAAKPRPSKERSTTSPSRPGRSPTPPARPAAGGGDFEP